MNPDFILYKEHPDPSELLSDLFKITPDFKSIWGKEDNYFIQDDGNFTAHGVFSEYSSYIRNHISEIDENTKKNLFNYIETCVTTNPNSSSGVSDAAFTCFLENLAGEGKLSSQIYEYLGEKSREHFDQWDRK